jgi:hypothetical protein
MKDVDDDVSLTDVFLTIFPWTMVPGQYVPSSMDEASLTDIRLAVVEAVFPTRAMLCNLWIWLFVGTVLLQCELDNSWLLAAIVIELLSKLLSLLFLSANTRMFCFPVNLNVC